MLIPHKILRNRKGPQYIKFKSKLKESMFINVVMFLWSNNINAQKAMKEDSSNVEVLSGQTVVALHIHPHVCFVCEFITVTIYHSAQ